jgi:predicted Fe-Mo cluster-binding NifX family protein
MKILIALNENKGENSKLSFHFGMAPFFAIYDSESKKLEIIKNEIDHSINISPADQIMKFNPEAIFSLGIGKKAINLFKEKGVKLKTGNFKILKEIIENIENLKDIEKSCEE